jgi:small redox-active disulfide protein 2
MKIQIAGPGCPNCQNTERNVVNACAELDFAADISHVTNIADILDLGVMRTPAVVIDGEVVLSGAGAHRLGTQEHPRNKEALT